MTWPEDAAGLRGELLAAYRDVRRRHAPWSAGHRYPHARGDAARAPTFVGVGAQKAGTSYVFDALVTDPAIAGPAEKETHYLTTRFTTHDVSAAAGEYHAIFGAFDEPVVGEWTPAYLYHPWAIPLLAEIAPDTKVLLLLRDPMARMVSGLRHEFRVHGRITAADVAEAHARSLYARQVRRLLDHFPREQVWISTFEEFVADELTATRRLATWLGGTGDVRPAPQPVNPSPAVDIPLEQRLLDTARGEFARDTAELAALLDRTFPDWQSTHP